VARISSLGRLGVILFFVHGSFVLMASLERMSAVTSSPSELVRAFWIRRALRIYPLAIFIIAAVALFHIPAVPDTTYQWIGAGGLLANLLLVQNLIGSANMLGPL
jgi:peptidoglycan/LPS O-acetylase OafA/YrhL